MTNQINKTDAAAICTFDAPKKVFIVELTVNFNPKQYHSDWFSDRTRMMHEESCICLCCVYGCVDDTLYAMGNMNGICMIKVGLT